MSTTPAPMLNERDATAIGVTFPLLAKLDEAIPEGYYVMCHQGTEGMRLWANDGYSPGVLVYEDDFWMFRADYKERPDG